MNLLELILGNFFGFGFALMLYVFSQVCLNRKEKKNDLIKQKNFLRLIKDEIIDNKLIIDSIRKHDFLRGGTIARLKTENKNGCWIKIIDFYHKNSDLIREINATYEVFRAINHVLNFEPFDFSNDEIFYEKISLSRKFAIGQFTKIFDDQFDNIISSIDDVIGDV